MKRLSLNGVPQGIMNDNIQSTDLFRHTILFAKFNMLYFSVHFLANIDKAYTPHDIPVEQGHSVSPNKVWREFFHGR